MSDSDRPQNGTPTPPSGSFKGGIHTLHTLSAVATPRPCDPSRTTKLANELSGWLATANAFSPRTLKVSVVIPDDTRPLSPRTVLPSIFEATLESAYRRGHPIEVTVVVASGLHKPPPQSFLHQIESSARPFRQDTHIDIGYEVHDARATEERGLPLNRHVMTPANGGLVDCVVTVGLVEPHQYAGFSGGLKAISVGCGASSTIAGIHSLEILRRDGVDIGRLSGNPFRQTVDALAASYAAPTFAVSLVPHPSGEGLAGIFAGNTNATYLEAVKLASALLLVPVERRYDFAVINVPEAKSRNFYQASRALTYVALHPTPCIREGGTLVIAARCAEGFGQGQGELTFRETLARGRAKLLQELQGPGQAPLELPGGAQRAYVLARALSRYRCVLIGADPLPEAQRAGVEQYTTLEEVNLVGDGLFVDDPFVALPFFKEV